MRRALHRAFSSGAGSQQPIARPRAVSSWGVHSKHGKHVLRYAAAGGAALALGYVAYLNDFDAARMGLRARETWGNLWDSKAGDSDPSVEDLQRALGDPPPPHVLTLIIAVEDVLLLREYVRAAAGRGGGGASRSSCWHRGRLSRCTRACLTLRARAPTNAPRLSLHSPRAAMATPCTPARACRSS